jgi:hypothetical protein
MARIEKRIARDGSESWRVSWRLGGTRTGPWQSVTVTTSERDAGKTAALAKAHGHELTRAQMLSMAKPSKPQVGESVAAMIRGYVDSLTVEDSTRREYDRTSAFNCSSVPSEVVR